MKAVTRKRYSAEFKVAADMEIGTSLLYGWIRKGSQPGHLGSGGLRARGEEPGADELPRLRRENARLKLEKRHFKKGCRHPRDQTPAGSRAMIQLVAQKTGGSIREVCAVLGEARSSFYHAAAPAARQVADAGLGDLIEAVFRRHRRSYGCRRTILTDVLRIWAAQQDWSDGRNDQIRVLTRGIV